MAVLPSWEIKMQRIISRRMVFLVVFGLVLGFGACFSQFSDDSWLITSASAQEEAVADTGVQKTLWSYIKIGGWIMIPIGMCSALSVGVLIELTMRLRHKVVIPPDVAEQVASSISVKDYQKAWQVVSEDTSVFSRVFSAAMERLPKGRDAVEEGAGEATAAENGDFNSKLNYLNLSAAIAPMLGLMGTISGMIKAFDAMAAEGAMGDPTKLAGDIGEALVTTFGGLVVAIPSMVIFFVMQNRLKKAMTALQVKVARFIDDIDFANLPPDLVIAGKSVTAAQSAGSHSVKASSVKASTTRSQAVVEEEESAGGEEVECPNCGKPITVGAEKCPHCGTEMAWE